MSGVMNSEWRIPKENEGADLPLTFTLSGMWAPGPGFWVESDETIWIIINLTKECKTRCLKHIVDAKLES